MAITAVALSPENRTDALRRLGEEQFDILVIGAGVVGAGAALDAASRGLKVGLVEARDFASGTSSRSSKLVHGGLRYLKQLNFHLVFEALRERKLILEKLCPHLARPVEFIYPLEKSFVDRAWVGTGVGVYDVLGAGRGVPCHLRHLSKKATLRSFRSGKPGAIKGGIAFYEGQLDDARHTMALARTAAEYGAAVASSTRVTSFLRDGDTVVGAVARDLESGNEIRIRATATINAAGVWTDEIQEMIGGKGQFRVRASKGVHIVVPRDRIDSDTGLITETEKSLLFIIPCPWSDDFWVIGTTDTPWDLDLAHPAASSADIDYILEHANALLAKPLTRDDVVGVYAGLRPLLAGESDETSKLSREHACISPVPGLVIVAGGKYTTYRVMAKDGVDLAAKVLGRPVPSCLTDDVPLVGAEGYKALVTTKDVLAARSGLVRRADRAPAGPLRIGDPRGPRHRGRAPRAGRAAGARPALPQGRGLLRGLARGRAAPRRPPGPPAAGVGRHLGPRCRRRARGRRDRRTRPRLGRRDDRARGRALPEAGRRRTRLAAPARRQDGRLRTARSPRGPGRSRVSTT